jgi:hypothetical protein
MILWLLVTHVAKITGVTLAMAFFFFLMILGFELRASHLLGSYSTD